MFHSVSYVIHASWNFWCAIFEPLPYGDPYLATLSFGGLVMFGVGKLIMSGASQG